MIDRLPNRGFKPMEISIPAIPESALKQYTTTYSIVYSLCILCNGQQGKYTGGLKRTDCVELYEKMSSTFHLIYQ